MVLSTKGRAEATAKSNAQAGLSGAQAYQNLSKAYPGLTESEKDAILKKYY